MKVYLTWLLAQEYLETLGLDISDAWSFFKLLDLDGGRLGALTNPGSWKAAKEACNKSQGLAGEGVMLMLHQEERLLVLNFSMKGIRGASLASGFVFG